jgi:hypothetical protein
MSTNELMPDLLANADFSNRLIKCIKRDKGLDQSLHQWADTFGMNCPKFEWDSGCRVRFAETKLAYAESLILAKLGTEPVAYKPR